MVGRIAGNYFDVSILETNDDSSLVSTIIKNLSLILILAIVFLIQIIIHELGHLVFGLVTGYSFVSFRIGSLTMIKEEGKFKLKRYNIPGTGGQCLMMPPDLKDGEFPFILYNLGGSILNAIVSIISILAIILIKDMNLMLKTSFILFALAGAFGALANGIPLKISGLPNDGYNVKFMIKDEEGRRSFYIQLRVNGLLSEGMRYRDMDPAQFQIKEESSVANPLNTNLRLLEYNYYLDKMDFENAKISIDSLVPYLDEIILIYVNEINCERIFLELIGECDKNFIDELYDVDLAIYIKKSKFMINKIRLLMAYEAFYNQDKEKAMDYYEELKDLYENYPVKGEADMELMIADWTKDRIK